ncbi:hypothetical protein BGZ72_010457 [Mortierella alpina]|nr:hypothetical protein BGZ72_010457 [Mortierella alpina]
MLRECCPGKYLPEPDLDLGILNRAAALELSHHPNTESQTQKQQDHGNSVAPLLQIVYNSGTFMRLAIKTRGMFVLEEIGAFEVPTKIAAIPGLAATIPALLAARDDVQQILDENINTLKRSWGYGDVPDIKKRLS